MRRNRGRRRQFALVAVGGALLFGGSAFVPTAAVAEPRYNLTAAADGLRLSVLSPGTLVVDGGEVGVPSTQATLSTLQGSEAFAGLPYPGADIAGLPGTLRGLTGLSQVPDYPGYVHSSDPSTPHAATSTPAGSLVATSTPGSSSARGIAGLDQAQAAAGASASSSVTVDAVKRQATALAVSDLSGLDAAGTVHFGRVHAEAKAVVGANGKPTFTSDLHLGQATVQGVGFDVTSDGIVLAGQNVPLPDASAVTDVLAAQGITVRYVAEQRLPNGVVSAGIEVTRQGTVPAAVPSLGGAPYTVTYRMGFAMALDTATFTDDPNFGVPNLSGSDTQQSSTPGVTGDGVTGGGSPAVSGAPALATGETGSMTGSAGPPSFPRTASAVGVAPSFGAGSVSWPHASDFYLVLVLAAATILFGGTVIRLLGVRVLWT